MMSVTTARPAPSEQRERGAGRRRWIPIAAGIGFTVSWVSGLVLPVPSLAPTAPTAEIIDKYGPHLAMVQAQFALTEGLPAVGLAVVAFALAGVARRSGSAASAASVAGIATGRARARVIAVAGTVAATISVAQYALGVMLAGWALSADTAGHAAGHASALWQALNRLDGVKMFALAVLAAAAVALTAPGGPLPRWLRYASLALAASITVSGVAYLFLIQALTPMAYVAGVALLVWVTGMGLALGRVSHRARR
jgi:hypothetical protein